MAYPVGLQTQTITGTFSDMRFSRETEDYTMVPKKGYVTISPRIKALRFNGVVYDLEDLVNTTYQLDEDGSFDAVIIISTQTNIEPNNGWAYDLKMSWAPGRVLTIVPTGPNGATLNISNVVIPDA